MPVMPPGLEVPETMIYHVYLTLFINVLAACISTPVIPYYSQSFGVSVAWIGSLYAVYNLAAMIFAPILSTLSDRWGRKRVLVICLLGAGVSNLIQGLALYCGRFGFWIFLLGRGFSGVWSSVAAICNVYVTDVASEEHRGHYLAHLALVPLVAIMAGPGLGGALAYSFGNNAPVVMDAALTLFCAALVNNFLCETPAFLRQKMLNDLGSSKSQAPTASRSADSNGRNVTVPLAVHALGCANLLSNAASQGNLAMLALCYQSYFGFTTLGLGWLCMGSAVVMIAANRFVVRPLKAHMGPFPVVMIGAVVCGLGFAGMGISSSLLRNLPLSAFLLYLGGAGSAIQASQASTIVAQFTNLRNRGRVFGIIQGYQNFGKIAGPILATSVAMHGIPVLDIAGSMGLPFILSGAATLTAGLVVFLQAGAVRKAEEETSMSPSLLRSVTQFGDAWVDEVGTEEDILILGRYTAKLLQERHYKWVSRREQIEEFFSAVLPVLEVGDRPTYESSLNAALLAKERSFNETLSMGGVCSEL